MQANGRETLAAAETCANNHLATNSLRASDSPTLSSRFTLWDPRLWKDIVSRKGILIRRRGLEESAMDWGEIASHFVQPLRVMQMG
ncbi:unnamed protein product [Clonostachys rosea]|uniref:Uncharacterized protein n=1 Tax=Bionectria ochroleuca TaxID=29856 RepID=A0ABY6UQQ2_BIOOC|nr:unnamed protein product [Clonostachys rosea]